MFFPNTRCLILLLIGSFSQMACVSMLFGPTKVKSEIYEYKNPPSPWTKIDPGTADVAYRHHGDQATLSLNSVCGQYQDLSLDDLAASLLLGLDRSRREGVVRTVVDGFPALDTTVSGQAAGTDLMVVTTVLRSDSCVYDFMLVARSASFSQHQEAYRTFIQGFHERRKKP